VAELVFNTAMTGYQEIMTDPSYAGQVVTFTFPHIGNTGVNPRTTRPPIRSPPGMVVKWDPTEPSNWRATGQLTDWLLRRGRIGMGGIDTRRLTRAIRQQGAPHVALAHDPEGKFDIEALVAKARAAGPRRPRPRPRRDLRAKLPLGRDALGLARGLRPPPGRACASSPSTTAPSATSCAASPRRAAR
jgi:carbamoylphosphate synthase small subunit